MHSESDLVEQLEAAVRDSEFRDVTTELPSDSSARAAKLATVLGFDALDAARGRASFEQLRTRRRAAAQEDEEIFSRARRQDPSGIEFDSDSTSSS